MYEGRRVIVLTPAGRKKYMPLVSHYVYQHKGLIDEWRLWANTRDANDLACLHGMAEADPTFVHVQTERDGPLGKIGEMPAIRAFYTKNYLDPKALYLRIDDDICYMHPDAIPNLVKFRHDNPDYFCITANMVNSGLCSHLHDRMHLHPRSIVERVPWESSGGPLHWSSNIATLLHDRFLKDVEKPEKLAKWMCFDRWELWENPRFGIAFIALNGEDIISLLGKWDGPERTDEEFFTMIHPNRIKRCNCICGKSLVVHFAYGPQRESGLETRDDEVLGVIPNQIYDRYKALAGVE